MARSFNGSTDKITVSLTTQLSSTTVGTFGGWFFPSTVPAAAYDMMSCTTSTPGDGVALLILSNGTANAAAWDAGNTQRLSINPAGDLSGGWHHIVLVYNIGSIASNTLYVDSVGTSANTTGSWAIGASQPLGFGIGAWISVPNPFSGRMADCFWSSAQLTAGEISALFKGQRPYTIRPKSLIGYWPFDGLVSPEPDFSGNALNGTLNGTTLVTGPPMTMFTPKPPIFVLGPSAAQIFSFDQMTTSFTRQIEYIGTP